METQALIGSDRAKGKSSKTVGKNRNWKPKETNYCLEASIRNRERQGVCIERDRKIEGVRGRVREEQTY